MKIESSILSVSYSYLIHIGDWPGIVITSTAEPKSEISVDRNSYFMYNLLLLLFFVSLRLAYVIVFR